MGRAWVLVAMLAAGCRELPGDADAASGPADAAAPDVNRTCGSCTDLRGRCGDFPDPCGGTLHCGCLIPTTCGGAGTPGVCGLDSDPYGTLADDALKTQLYSEVANQTGLGYTAARTAMYVSPGIDIVKGKIECLYTGRLVDPDGTLTPGGFSTEHAWPQSLGAGTEPARSDLHHLFPVDGTANTYRSNYLYGWAACGGAGQPACRWAVGGSKLGTVLGGTDIVFEVRTQKRGDAARATFYFSVRYQLPITPVEEGTLRVWNEQDPPDDVERTRNYAIDGLQHNLNPFVDRPDLIQRIADF